MTKTEHYKLSQWEKPDKVLMEDFNTDNLNVENALAGLESSKAKQTDLAALQTTVGTKANQSDLAALQTTVGTKANQSDLAALKTEVAAKATSAALTNLQNTVTQLSSTLTSTQASMLKLKVGTYDGNGAANRFIDVGFTPKAVLVCDMYGAMCDSQATGRIYYRGGLAVTGGPAVTASYNGSYLKVVEITTNGFYVTQASIDTKSYPIEALTNTSSISYRYVAIG